MARTVKTTACAAWAQNQTSGPFSQASDRDASYGHTRVKKVRSPRRWTGMLGRIELVRSAIAANATPARKYTKSLGSQRPATGTWASAKKTDEIAIAAGAENLRSRITKQ